MAKLIFIKQNNQMNHRLLELESMQLPPFQGRIQKMRFREIDRPLLGQEKNSGQKCLLLDATMSSLDHRAQFFGAPRIRYCFNWKEIKILRGLMPSLLL